MIETFLFVRLGEGEEVFRRWPTAVTLLCPRGRRSTERFRQNCRGFLPEADRSTVALDAFFFVIVIRRLVLVKPATGQKIVQRNCSVTAAAKLVRRRKTNGRLQRATAAVFRYIHLAN